jgi:hypothetical protein
MQLVPLHHGDAAQNISALYIVGTGGVTRSKRRAMQLQWLRKAADMGIEQSCVGLAGDMYRDRPHARVEGHVEVEATGVAMSAADMEGHDHVPPEVLKSVVYWLRKACVTGQYDPLVHLEVFRRRAVEGTPYCCNDGCEVMGHLKDFKVCPRCKTAKCARSARPPGTVPMRARNRTGQRVGTRRRAAHTQVLENMCKINIFYERGSLSQQHS